MSSKRPGTVDYSKFDNIDSDSDSESEDSYTPNVNNINKSQFDDNDSEDDYSSEDSVPSIPVPAVPSPVSYCLFTTPYLIKISFLSIEHIMRHTNNYLTPLSFDKLICSP